jgi:hypothetical protein
MARKRRLKSGNNRLKGRDPRRFSKTYGIEKVQNINAIEIAIIETEAEVIVP